MLYGLSSYYKVFINFLSSLYQVFIHFSTAEKRIYSRSLELSDTLWYNDANNLIRCGGFGGYIVACHGGYWCGFI